MTKDRVELTPDNFCYLSNCQFFISDIQSTGCKIDYMRDKKKKDTENLCPLDMERAVRSGDSDWELDNNKVIKKLRDINDLFKKDSELIKKMGRDSYIESLNRCSELAQKAYKAKIEYEKLQYKLQEMKERCFGNYEKEKR